MTQMIDVAVVGADSVVGEAVVTLLEERNFPLGTLHLLAGGDAVGQRVEFGGKRLPVRDVEGFDFSLARVAFFCAGQAVSERFVPKATAAGSIAIDTSDAFATEPDVPLVVPEVNGHAVAGYRQRGIIACPRGLVAVLAVVLKPLHEAAGVARVNLATYQAVSGNGKKGAAELAGQTANLLNFQQIQPKLFSHQIAFNVLGRIGEIHSSGYSHEEMEMIWETQKLFADDPILLNPTAARVPVFFGDSAAAHLETRVKMSAQQVRALLEKTPGIVVVDTLDRDGYPTAVTEAAQQDLIYVGRIREDLSHPNGLDLWIVADGSRRGTALNSVQVAEILVKDFL